MQGPIIAVVNRMRNEHQVGDIRATVKEGEGIGGGR